jgi:hypothetical protein
MVDIDETVIAFAAPEEGIYRFNRLTGQITIVADTSRLIPGRGGEKFSDFSAATVSTSDGRVAFGYDPYLSDDHEQFLDIYVHCDGALQKVIGVDDQLDGKAVEGVWLGAQGFRGDEIAFLVRFADQTEGIYVATLVPEPSTALLILVAAYVLVLQYRMKITTCLRGSLQAPEHN